MHLIKSGLCENSQTLSTDVEGINLGVAFIFWIQLIIIHIIISCCHLLLDFP